MSESQYLTLRINRAEPELADQFSGDWLRIEQPEWREPSDADFAAWLKTEGKGNSIETLLLYWAQFKSFCVADGVLEVELQIHRSRADLPYTLTASYGVLSGRFIHQTEHTLSRGVSMAEYLDLEVQVVGLASVAWEGQVVAEDGSIIPPPPILQQGSLLTWGGIKVAGVLRLRYTEQHDAYILEITPRAAADSDPNDDKSAYQSTVMAIWGAGEVETHDVELPDMSGYCGGANVSVIINPDDPDDGQCVRHNILVDPCTQEVIREWDEAIPCPEEED